MLALVVNSATDGEGSLDAPSGTGTEVCDTVTFRIMTIDPGGAPRIATVCADIPVLGFEDRIARFVVGIRAFHAAIGVELVSVQMNRHRAVETRPVRSGAMLRLVHSAEKEG